VTLGKIIEISQRLLKLMARARISEFESYMPSQAVGLCRPNRWLVTAAAVTTGRGGRGAPSSRNHGSHSLARMPRPARLLRLWTVPPQRNAERGLAIRRNTSAVSLPTNGLHTLWNDWCRCAPRQGAACQQEACVAAVTGVPSKVPRLARARAMFDSSAVRRRRSRARDAYCSTGTSTRQLVEVRGDRP
jgi:hypothetical protein